MGYVNVSTEDSYDFGYGLKRILASGDYHRGRQAIIGQFKKDGIPYITATHDIHNPRSGEVMKRLGMKYQYSYKEKWQPKNFFVIFRMYQLNLDGNEDRVYRKYWDISPVHLRNRHLALPSAETQPEQNPEKAYTIKI